jgi:hypothetical protein
VVPFGPGVERSANENAGANLPFMPTLMSTPIRHSHQHYRTLVATSQNDMLIVRISDLVSKILSANSDSVRKSLR